jgi:sugar phosphate isomerase/epimerase
VVNPWDSQFLDTLDYQWGEVVIPFWTDIESRARDAGVKVAIEMHPHNVVFNPGTMERLATEINATHVGAEMDPSHLFWQGIDPVAAIEHLGSLVYHAAAKDTRINERNCRVYGVLDDRFERVPAGQNPVNIGGRNTLNRWPADASWQFVAVGRGHDQDFWVRFLRALYAVDPGIAVNIEHEDAELDQIEGLRQAAKNLTAAAAAAGLTVSLPGGQGEVEAVPGGAVDVAAVLHRAVLVVVGRPHHRQHRCPLGFAERTGLRGGAGLRADRLLGDPEVDAVRAEQVVQALRLEVFGGQLQQVRRNVVVHQRERLRLGVA